MGFDLFCCCLLITLIELKTIPQINGNRRNGPCHQGWSSTCLPGMGISFPTPSQNISSPSTPPQPNPDYASDPVRDMRLVNLTFYPYNGETPPDSITSNFYTPNEIFYVRNNLPVPHITNISNYRLEITGIGFSTPILLTLAQLQSPSVFPAKNISAVLQCAGNRRAEMNAFSPVSGGLWNGGAIGNALWEGADLRDVLAHAGFNVANYTLAQISGMHIQFEGLDKDPNSGAGYGASIPLSYFLDGNFHPILAYSMNGQELSRDHGYPLRVILPGIVGARNVKWLTRIRIAEEESNTPYQRVNYKAFSSSLRKNTVRQADYDQTPSIMELPVNSYITSHKTGDVIKYGSNLISGYAYSGGGKRIVRVEISQNRGRSWDVASITQGDNAVESTRSWSWVFWNANISLPRGSFELWVKAVDNGYNQQPENINSIWNFRGYLTNSYHKIRLVVA